MHSFNLRWDKLSSLFALIQNLIQNYFSANSCTCLAQITLAWHIRSLWWILKYTGHRSNSVHIHNWSLSPLVNSSPGVPAVTSLGARHISRLSVGELISQCLVPALPVQLEFAVGVPDASTAIALCVENCSTVNHQHCMASYWYSWILLSMVLHRVMMPICS